MIERTTDDKPMTVSIQQRKHPRRHIPRRSTAIDSFRPLTFQAAATDLHVEHVHLFPERGSIVLSLVTGSGTAIFLLPFNLARELGDGMLWLVDRESSGTNNNNKSDTT
jgi:hypothetical protein